MAEMKRFLAFLRLVLVLTTLMFGTWWLSAAILPQGLLRPYFSRLFSARVNEFAFGPVLLANLWPFFGVQFMNLFKVGKHAGGSYILPIFWIVVGLLYGTNSLVFADQPVAFSITVVWTRTGFMELLAYTTGYEATKGWWLWEQHLRRLLAQNESHRIYSELSFLRFNRPRTRLPVRVIGGGKDFTLSLTHFRDTAAVYETEPVIYDDRPHDLMLVNGWQLIANDILDWLIRLVI